MLNLRRPVTRKKSKDEIDALIKDENLKRLTPALIQELERLVPLRQGRIFKRIGWDCTETRTELMKLFIDKVLSLKIVQMEIRRRKKMKRT